MLDDEFSLVQGEKVVMGSLRVLLGWMNDAQATHFLLGRQPLPADDLAPIQQKIKDCQTAVAARPVRKPVNPMREIGRATAAALKARPDIQAAFAPLQWEPALVDLRQVLSYQQIIHLEGLEDRVASVPDDLEELVKFCLPINEPINQLGGFVDPDQKGFTISSLNPNLRIHNALMHDAEVPPGPGLSPVRVKAVTFFIGLGTSYFQVGQYKNRYFIRDGYHRAVGLLKKGIHIVPCILVEARNTDELGLKQGMFTYEVLYGERPPRLADFWDDTVAGDGKNIAFRRVLRLRGEEFNVQR
jgi:hypothetical protein